MQPVCQISGCKEYCLEKRGVKGIFRGALKAERPRSEALHLFGVEVDFETA